MVLTCDDCKGTIKDSIDLKEQSWTRLANYLYIEYLQGDISENLYKQLYDDLLWIKPQVV